MTPTASSPGHLHPPRVLLQPGWQNSGPDHWQTHWERRLGSRASRVEEQDWELPLREDWVATLRDSLATQAAPVILVAHSIGCLTLAHLLGPPGGEPSRPSIAAAVLVAPADVERDDAAPELASFHPIPMQPLGVPALVIASTDDPYCALFRATAMAQAWRADLHTLENAGHINTEAGFGPWLEGWQYVKHWLAARGLTWPADGGDIA